MADFDKNTVYILDSYGLIFRCYFAFINRPLTNPDGQNISGLFGFFRNFHYILQHYKPGYIFAAMDSKTKTFRHEKYAEYKATRNKTPEDLHAQIPWIEEVLKALGVPVLQCDRYEADDVIATVAKKCQESGKTLRILSGDKDLMQLVNDSVQILKPENGGGWKVTDSAGVEAEWGVKPAQLLDLLSLYGDSADNIPGVMGIGVKTAGKLLNQYENLEGIYSHIDEIKGAVQKKLIDGEKDAYFSRELVKLFDQVPCGQIDQAMNAGPETFNFGAAAEILKKYGAFQVAKSYAELAVENGQDFKLENSEPENLKNQNKSENQVGESLPPAAATEVSSASPSSGHIPQRPVRPVFTEYVQNKGNYTAVLTLNQLSEVVEKCIQNKTCAFDCETDSLDTITAHILGFSLCCEKGTAWYVPLSQGESLFEVQGLEKAEAFAELKKLFENPEVNVVFHNGKFDLKVLASNGLFGSGVIYSAAENQSYTLSSIIKCSVSDTMIGFWLENPDRAGKSYGLEYLGETVLGLKGIEFNDIVQKGQTFRDVPLEQAVPYAAEDADFTFQLWEKLLEVENPVVKSELYGMEMKVLPVLAQMELNGIHLDSKILNDYNSELTAGIEAAEKQIYTEVGHTFNIASPKQLQTVLFEERKLPAGKKTKTGYSTDTSVLEELALLDPVPKMILEYREMAKLQSTYVETLPELTDKNGRIHTDFVQTGTATGRLSCREPNLQNIPVRSEAGRKIRSAFTAPEGKVLISADYAQIELVVLAHLSGDKKMCQAFIDGTDVHKSTAALIYGVTPENVTPEMRRTAKTINFGVIYGMSAFRLANDLGISRTQAKQFIDSYFAMYSSINNFISETVMKAEETGYVETILGRRRYIMNINSRNKLEKSGAERIAVNTPVQGSAADIVKKAMLAVNSALQEKNNGTRLLLQVHDELIFECPDKSEIIEETVKIIKDKMENAVKLSVPLRVSIEYGKNWGEFH